MKKIISLLLALLMVFSLVACGGNGDDAAKDSPAADKPAADKPAADDKAPADEPADAPADEPAEEGTIGYYTDNVDHFARKKYKFAYFVNSMLQMNQTFYVAFKAMEPQYNFEIGFFSGENEAEKYLNNMDNVIVQGYDGMIVDMNMEIADRIYEVAVESEIPFILMGNSYKVDGKNMAPTVAADQYINGNTQIEWVDANYDTYFKGVDRSKVNLMSLQFTSNPALIERHQGVIDKFNELFPGNPVWEQDLLARGLSVQSAYDEVSAVFAANPDVEYWLIAGVVEDFAQGAARASEDYQKGDSVLIISSGSSILPTEFDTGYDGRWVASYAVYSWDYVVPTLSGLCALVDGRATWDTLWPDKINEGDLGAFWPASATMITKEIYKDVERELAAAVGVNIDEVGEFEG